jgi:transcriptional regulator with XRE-family HTH domain
LSRKPSFARYLRDARIKRGMSAPEVAEQIGVSPASIYFWETDHCGPARGKSHRFVQGCKVADQGHEGDG